MKYLLLLCLFLLSLSSCKQKTFFDKVTVWPGDKNVESLDMNNGFKTLKLGHHISAFSGFLEKRTDSRIPGCTTYQVKADSLASFNIDEIKIKSIEAHFFNDLLYQFQVEFSGENNAFPFFLLLIEAYGGAYPEDGYAEVYEWNGKRVRLKYTVEPNRNAIAEFTSVVVSEMTGAAGAGTACAELLPRQPRWSAGSIAKGLAQPEESLLPCMNFTSRIISGTKVDRSIKSQVTEATNSRVPLIVSSQYRRLTCSWKTFILSSQSQQS